VAPPGTRSSPLVTSARGSHFLLPIRGKGSSHRADSWAPILGPLVGGALAGLVGAWYVS